MAAIPVHLTAGTGVFTRAEALATGHTDADLQAWVRRGEIRRLRPGIFGSGALPEYADGRLLERAYGLSRRHGDRLAISHHAALLLHGVAVFGVPMGILHATDLNGAARSGAGVHLSRPRTPPPSMDLGGVRVVRPEV
ncbi:MAG: type IV toxin-antitoxin system AbiEi family antitoxin domain-containing protein, partial [Ornithinimicrobium sp.]